MGNNFEKELFEVLNEDVEIPNNVRKTLDNTYDLIKSQKTKKKNPWSRGIVAACCLIIILGMLTNESVKAIIKPFINFNDRGIERAVDGGLSQQNVSSALDKNIKITLDNYFYDSNKLGLSFKIKIDASKLVQNDIERVTVFYSIKNGNGDYIMEYTAPQKTLKGKNNIISHISEKNPVLDIKNGAIQYDVILESAKGTIPKLENAEIEIDSVNIFYKRTYEDEYKETNDKVKIIEGTWNLSLNDSKQEEVQYVEYEALNNKSKIEILSAKASPTSFNLKFAINTIFKNNKLFIIEKLSLKDDKGNIYESQGWHIEEKDGKTIITTNFPVSAYENVNKYKLILSKIREDEINGGFKQLMPDVELELTRK